MKKLIRSFEIILSITSLTIGGLIYLGFRNESLIMFTWANRIGASVWVQCWRDYCSHMVLPDWVLYCLPDGLWSFSCILFFDAIWMDYKNKRFIFYASILPCIAIVLEFFQLFGILSGTFDPLDLCCYVGAILLFSLLKIIKL